MALRPSNPDSKTPAVSREEAQQEGFLREVDEALRQDEALELFQKHGKKVGGVIALGLLAFAGWLGWQDYRDKGREQQAETFVTALDQLRGGNFDGASKGLDPLVKDGTEGNKAAAAMVQAGIAAAAGKTGEAADRFSRVANDESAPQAYRDLAKLRAVALKFDAMPPEQVVAELKPLAVPGKPWFGSAGELVAIAYMKQNKPDQAGPLLAAISRDKTVPDSLRRRTRQMAGLLGVDAVDDVKQAAADMAQAAGPAGPGGQ